MLLIQTRILSISRLLSTRAAAFETRVDRSAVIESDRIGRGVFIGPKCYVGPDVTLHDGVRLGAQVVVAGRTSIGAGSRIGTKSCLGHRPQDRKWAGEESELRIGNGCDIGAEVTVHPGTKDGGGVTILSEGVVLKDRSHVAHDCILNPNVFVGTECLLAGHVEVGSGAWLGPNTAVHQKVHIGPHARLLRHSALDAHLLPYSVASGNRATLQGLHVDALRYELAFPPEYVALLTQPRRC